MLYDKGNEKEINISAEDDTSDFVNHSLIDCLFYLKQNKTNYKFKFNDYTE